MENDFLTKIECKPKTVLLTSTTDASIAGTILAESELFEIYVLDNVNAKLIVSHAVEICL